MDIRFRIYALDELGPDGYPREWHATIKHQVRADAGDRCVRCGHPYARGAGEWSPCDEQCAHDGPVRGRNGVGEWALLGGGHRAQGPRFVGGYDSYPEREAQWRILTVHHLNGVKPDCRWWNLAALCQRCHLQIQGKVQMARVWPWEHSEWFRPYVAGFYAWTYLGLDLTRAQVEARLDELLALERVA